jgi:uncharacterized protein (DUF362 family)
MNSTVAITRCGDYETGKVYGSVKTAVDLLGGMDKFVRKGDKVLLKPNLLCARTPEKAVTTHPEIIRALIRLVREAGGVPVVGDSPSASITHPDPVENFKSINKLWELTGMKKVCEEEGAELVSFERGGVETFRVEGRKHTPVVIISKKVLECDSVINLAKLKTHNLTLYTGAVKNLFGCVPGIRKTAYHAEAIRPADLSELLVDILGIIRPRLSVLDGVLAMDGNGPNTGRVINAGVLLASADCVALDAVGSGILGFKPLEISTTRIAASRGLGEADIGKIAVLGEPLEGVLVKDPKKPMTEFIDRIPENAGKILSLFFRFQPLINESVCTDCGECAKSCPAGAIMRERSGRLQVVRKKCIMCMCCNEVCRYGAVEVRANRLISFMMSIARKILR